MNQAEASRAFSLLALASQRPALTEVQAHLGALNTALVIGSPISDGFFTAQERASAQSDAFARWTLLCRAMARLEVEWPLAAENGREAAKRLLDELRLSEDAHV